MQVHHTGILASDLERSIAFYTRLLGFRVTERGEFGGQPLAFLVIPGGMIELVQEAGGSRTDGELIELMEAQRMGVESEDAFDTNCRRRPCK